MRLDALKIPKAEPRRADVDISAAFGEKSGGIVLQFQEPNAAQLFQVGGLSKTLKKRNPDWADELCQSVSLLAVSHIAPDAGDKDPLVFYTELANENAPLFIDVLGRYGAAFPDTQNFSAAVDNAKND